MARAIEHVFERRTVIRAEELTAEVLRQSYGQYSLRDLKEMIAHKGGLVHARGQMSTVAALELECSLVGQINAGVGTGEPLGQSGSGHTAGLTPGKVRRSGRSWRRPIG